MLICVHLCSNSYVILKLGVYEPTHAVDTKLRFLYTSPTTAKETTIRFLHVTHEAFDANALNAYDTDIADELKRRSADFDSFELEIGSGNGKFLVEHAIERPNTFFVGIERSLKAVNRSVSKASKRGLKNALFLLGEANTVIDEYLRDRYRFDAVYLNFPDPWPKKKHNKRRILVQDGFLNRIYDLLVENGLFFLVTDDVVYATEVMSPTLKVSELFTSTLQDDWVYELPGYKPTLYEEKMRAKGMPIHYLRYRKTKGTR